MAQVGKAATPGLPLLLVQFYEFINVFELDFGAVVPSACLSGSVFGNDGTVLGILVCMLCMACVLALVDQVVHWTGRQSSGTIQRMRKGVFLLLSFAYPLACNTSLTLLYCVPMDVETVITDAQSGLQHFSTKLESRLVSKPDVECYVEACMCRPRMVCICGLCCRVPCSDSHVDP